MKRQLLKVFIIDDDYFFYTYLGEQLCLCKKTAVKAFNKAEACFRFMKEKPDVIFLDYHLDGNKEGNMNGFMALQEIKRLDPDVPVVMISGTDKTEELVKCLNHGASNFIIKNPTTHLTVKSLMNIMFPAINKNN